MKYLKIKLKASYICSEGHERKHEGALDGEAYMVLSNDGTQLIGYKTLDGDNLELPENQEVEIIDKKAKPPEWA